MIQLYLPAEQLFLLVIFSFANAFGTTFKMRGEALKGGAADVKDGVIPNKKC